MKVNSVNRFVNIFYILYDFERDESNYLSAYLIKHNPEITTEKNRKCPQRNNRPP